MNIRALQPPEIEELRALAQRFGYPGSDGGLPVALGAFKGEEQIGGCLGRMGKPGQAAALDFVYVHGLSRGQGAARRLVEAFAQLARRSGTAQIVTQYIDHGGQSPVPFLSAMGFADLRRCEVLLCVHLADLELTSWAQRPTEKAVERFQCLADMDAAAFARCRIALEHSVPEFATLRHVAGELLGGNSYVSMGPDGQVDLSVLFADYDGKLYLHSLYCRKGWERHLLALLKLALSGACELKEDYDLLYVTCINEASLRLARRITQEVICQERASWRMYRPL